MVRLFSHWSEELGRTGAGVIYIFVVKLFRSNGGEQSV